MKSIILTILLFILVNILLIKDAQSYLDPGTGSLFLQILIASLLGALFAIKMFWRKIKNFFLKLFKKKPADE